jgi:hypothetical protein
MVFLDERAGFVSLDLVAVTPVKVRFKAYVCVCVRARTYVVRFAWRVSPCLSLIHGDQKLFVHLIAVQKQAKIFQTVSITYHDNVVRIRVNRWRAILNTVFEDAVRRVNECLETSEGHFEH